MIYLIAASLLWAFSFGLIGRYLGGLDSQSVAFVRLLISLLVFVPLLHRRGLRSVDIIRLMAIGAVQFGLMYAVYIRAYQTLAGHEVALFTIMTPLFVAVLDDWRRKQFQWYYFVAAVVAVAGGGVMAGMQPFGSGMWTGVLMIQVANLCFAAGQVEYKCMMETKPSLASRPWHHFGWLYAGAVLVSGVFAMFSGLVSFRPSLQQGWVLLYLGVVPSALGFYFWNLGAKRVNAGVLAVFNNVKIPLAVLVSLFVFREQVNVIRLSLSLAAIAVGFAIAAWRRSPPKTA